MLKSLLARLRAAPKPVFEDPKPEASFAVIGDIHGRLDLLQALLEKLPGDVPVICVGDYIDRGPASVETLRFLKDRPEITCLKGNHEDMLVSFVTSPEEKGPRWIRNGGLQTLADLGIRGLSEMTRGMKLREARNTFVNEVGEELIDWVRELPLIRWSGNIAVLHAGADPAVPIEDNPARTLIWGHPDFMTTPRQDGWWIAHGHTIVDEAVVADGRISLDTGAYATGRLTAAVITPDGIELVST
ncbi:Serine/threonine-protein phosphatase 2 (plasmid) [Roseivivax sp. THAF40]|uniref:metallophosphoesterase family protein n=1 Tax=Roseivivax sp. THAF40 TaxID=2587858 RepID=UPI001268A0C3|nr:metallophosphoesterase family protein [Roseivivax sp. THAF40]QFT48696.1 Serine/threonine-protein phosphatase 2 [Roseivivax sp. THAF40]